MQYNIANTTTTNLKGGLPNFSVGTRVIDDNVTKSFEWTNPDWSKYLGYYKEIPELKQAIDSLAMWTAGKGWTVKDSLVRTYLENIRGWGEDTFDSLMQNMLIVKKTNGDAFAQIMRHDKKKHILLNIKPLNPSRVKIVVGKDGIIDKYKVQNSDGTWKDIAVEDMFHISNNRVANEIHGTSVIESCQWIIDARNEAMSNLRRIMHRSTIRVLYVDQDDLTKAGTFREQYKEAIKNGEVLILPGKSSDNSFQDLQVPPTQAYLEWIRYLENFFYQAVGIPKIILGGSQEFTEASSKVGYLTFEQVYAAEQRLLEQDIWNQLGIKITFERPVSLKEDILTSEAANTGQVGFQPNETEATISKTE